jgi:hypothetical protein
MASKKDDILGLLDDTSRRVQYDFITNYKNIWADNGDRLSLCYAGTGALNLLLYGMSNKITQESDLDIYMKS